MTSFSRKIGKHHGNNNIDYELQPVVDSNKVQEYIKKAVRQAADYNTALMAERREERLYYFDMQTLVNIVSSGQTV